MQLVGFTLPDKDNGKPAAAFTTAVAGIGYRNGLRRIHIITFQYPWQKIWGQYNTDEVREPYRS